MTSKSPADFQQWLWAECGPMEPKFLAWKFHSHTLRQRLLVYRHTKIYAIIVSTMIMAAFLNQSTFVSSPSLYSKLCCFHVVAAANCLKASHVHGPVVFN